MQEYKLGKEVFVFRTQKGNVSFGKGRIHLVEINTSGYIQYSVKVFKGNDAIDTWIVNHASMARTEEEIKQKADVYKQFNEEQKKKYVELFGAPEFDPTKIGLK
ncbi:MAG: hypothetical protein J6S67_23355 [Methanobrevibacter sp.]|nr:hypothetical protein [Methanobrevibacter sp.]